MMTTDTHDTFNTDECLFSQDLLAEAAMRTLEPEVQQRMECHLARCRMCREDLAQIEETLQLLAFSVDQFDPPANAKQNLMARFDAERHQAAPDTFTTTIKPTPAPKPTRTVSAPDPTRHIARRFPWSYASVFSGLAIALLLIGAWNFLPFAQSDGELPRGQIEVMAMETTCPDCHDATGGQIGADPKEKDGLVMAWNLDPERKHEVWCVNRDGLHTKVGDLVVADTGSVMQKISFPDEVGGYQQIYVIRDDGAQELSVAPATTREDDQPASEDDAPAE